MDSNYMQASVDLVNMPKDQAKRHLLVLLRTVSHDHRWPIGTRLAYMSELLVAHRRLWSADA